MHNICFFCLNVYDQQNYYQNILRSKWTQTWLKRFIAITVSSVCRKLTELCHQMSKTWTRINARVVSMVWSSNTVSQYRDSSLYKTVRNMNMKAIYWTGLSFLVKFSTFTNRFGKLVDFQMTRQMSVDIHKV